MVHAAGFAPATSCAQGKRSTGLNYAWMVGPVGLATDISRGKSPILCLRYDPMNWWAQRDLHPHLAE